MACSGISVLCSGVESGQPGWKSGILASSPPGASTSKLPQALVTIKKCISLGGKICNKTKQNGAKFITRDTAQVGEEGFAYLRWKQGRNTRLERNGVGNPPHEEGCSKEAVKWVAYSGSSGSFFTFGQISVFWGFFPHIWLGLGPSPTCMCKLLFQDGFQPRGLWGALASHIMGCCPLLFDPQGAFLLLCLPCPTGGKCVTFWSFTQVGFTPSLPLPKLLS